MIISRTFDFVVFCYNLFAVDSLRLKLHTQDLITITNAVDTQNLPAFIFPASLRNWLRFCHELKFDLFTLLQFNAPDRNACLDGRRLTIRFIPIWLHV